MVFYGKTVKVKSLSKNKNENWHSVQPVYFGIP